MDRPRSVNGDAVHNRYFGFWDLYYATIALVLVVAAGTVDDLPAWRRTAAVGAILAMVLVHVVVGRRLVRAGGETRAALAVLLVQIALFAVASATVPFTTWLLFAVTPMIFQMVALRAAIGIVVATNLVPVAVDVWAAPEQVPMDVLIALVASAGGSWLGFWIIRVIEQSNERAALIAELEASRAEVGRLSHEAGAAAERARLAGEIHDTLAQGFTSIITLLQAADPALRDERLALAVRTAKENLAESRALIAALSPSALAAGSLPDSVRRQASRFQEETGTPATVRVTGEQRTLPTAVEVVLLRAAQEALTNVRRHAVAREAAVVLSYTPDSVRLSVRDDGRGFVPGESEGFGLAGMRARAEQVAGTLTIHSDPDTGTTLELEVPA